MTSQELSKILLHEIRKKVQVYAAISLQDIDELERNIEVFLLKKFDEGRHVGRDHDEK